MTIDKKHLKITNNYANALLKIGKEQNSADKLYKQLREIVDILNISKDLKLFFENPLISVNDKKEIIYKVFGKNFDLQIINLLNMLADNKKLNLLETIYYCFEKLYEKSNEILRVRIISAVEMNSESKSRLIKILEKKSGCKIITEYAIKNDIIGGLIIKINDKVIDLSLASKIKNMEKQLI